MLRSRLVALSLTLGILPDVSIADCAARDFFTLPLPSVGDRLPTSIALEIAYPGLKVDDAAKTVSISGDVLPLGENSGRPARERLLNPSIIEQFAQIYPLSFDFNSRTAPWFDPGRARHDGLFRSLYGRSEAEVAANLVRVSYQGVNRRARFSASKRQCVAQQLHAALAAIAAEGPEMDIFFSNVGGSFNWRVIAGTGRLSAHSFGIAVDFNTSLGGYWRWSGAKEGSVGHYDNQYPEALVQHMERYGFIWGGKWHHFDGMHFEYRPELILYARLLATNSGN